MKKTCFLILLSFICIYSGRSQNITHPTIQNALISYKAPASHTLSIQGIQGYPTATISLKTNTAVTVIHFKISDVATNTEIYEVDYNITSSPVIDNEKTLFQNNNGALLISYGQTIKVMPHKYEIWTEDAQHNASTILSLIR